MATAGTSIDLQQEIQKNVDSLHREVEGLRQALRRSRQIRLLLLVALATLAGVSCYLFYGLYCWWRSTDYLAEIQAAAQQQLDKKSDDYLRELQRLSDRLAPVVSNAFMKQIETDIPVYAQAMEMEGTPFRENVEREVRKRLQSQVQSSYEKHRKLLEQEVQALDKSADLERVGEHLRRAINQLVDRYHVAELDRQLQSLAANWDGMPAATATKGEESPQDQFLGSLLLLLQYRMTHAPALAQP